MALETAQYISDLNTTNPASTDSVAQADDHLRLIKAALKNTFPNITGPVTLTQSQINSPIPSGLITMWSGAISAIPSGWALCDGSNGTPDLRGRFLMGASSATQNTTGGSGTTGASGSHTHTMALAGNHDHGGSTGSTSLTVAQMPSHTHTGSYLKADGTGSSLTSTAGGTLVNFSGSVASTGAGEAHSHTVSVAGNHIHTVNSVGNHTHSFTPPYYALAYIMKL